MASLRGRVAAMECCLCESPCPTPRNDRRADADEGGAAPVSPSTGRRTRRLDGFYSLEKTAKALQAADLRQLTEARLCGAPGALTKTGCVATDVQRHRLLRHASCVAAAKVASHCCGLLDKLHQEMAQEVKICPARKRGLSYY